MKTLGNIIEKGRFKKGLSIKETAELISVSRTTLARLESGHSRIITIENIIKLSNILELDFFEILKACDLILHKIEINSLIKESRIYYKGTKVDKVKLEQLLNENLANIAE